MSFTETPADELEENQYTGSSQVSGQPTTGLFSLMEDEAGGVTPEPSHITDLNQEFVNNEISPIDYYSSNFPSLITHLGPKAKNKTNRSVKKKRLPQLDVTDESYQEKGREKRHKEQLTFTQQMRRRNEAQWLRIEAVVKEKMDYYEKYVSDMTLKIKQQRAKINQRAEQLLMSLQKQEDKKREERLYASPYGRMWRHHRTMQRRALSLEPVRP